MLFSSVTFVAFFLPAFLAAYYLVPKKLTTARNAVLLLFSIVFYAWGGVRYLALIFASIAVNYLAGLLLGRLTAKGARRAALAVCVVCNLALLGVFKYANFVTSTLASWGVLASATSIALPIGISFYTFQGMSYVFDVYKGDAASAKNPLTVALYISLFPQLVAGPIVRYTDIERELTERSYSTSEFTSGAVRFAMGFGKKLILANAVGEIADEVFSRTGTSLLTAPLAWLGAIAFALQIYFDFSAYSDMAIGLGKMIGFHFNENFDYPYISSSVTEFWRRWHISLSSWFRAYVYIPLGGNRRGVPRQIFNLFVVWALTGMWHGANWTFIVWGLYYGALLIVEKFVLKKALEKVPRVFRHIVTLFLVLIGWVLFRSETLGGAWTYICSMFGASGSGAAETVYLIREYAVELVIALVAVLPLKKLALARFERNGKTPVWAQIAVVASALFVFALAYMKLVSGSFAPFIYFQF